MKSPQEYIHVFWDEDELGYRWPCLRDTSGQLLEPFTSYLESLVAGERKLRANPKGVQSKLEHATYALGALAAFLVRHQRKLYRVNDDWLEELREAMLKDIRSNPISRGSSHATQRTTNKKLENIYKFLHWSQKNRRAPKGTIGWLKCRVRSSLPESETRAAKIDFKPNHLYPLCYQRVGGSTRQNEGQYCATPEDLAAIEDFFWATHTFDIAERNTLAMRIQEFTGWRNESINSLTVDQFTTEALRRKRAKAFCLICPPKQKYSYEKDFAVDWLLIDRIVEYIKNGRQHLLEQAGGDESVTQGRLFIGAKGRPLTDSTYGEIFTTAFKAIGAPKGAGGHSIRRYRTVEEVKSEISRRKVNGRPIDRDTIVRIVMELLGHNSEEAGRAYDRVTHLTSFESRESELWRRIQAAELQRDALRVQVAHLLSSLPEGVLKTPPTPLLATQVALDAATPA